MDLAFQADDETEIEASLEASSVIQTGRTFGNYEVLDQIGQGGMGIVYRARQRGLGRVVALKFLLAGTRATEGEIRRFQTEARAAAKLNHPNIVAIHEVGEHEGQHYISMDYVEGRSLAEWVRITPLPPAQAARYVVVIAEAIHHAHERGLLHRDLKPHNVLMDPQGQPRITDFGLARHLEVESDLTQSGAVLGTPSYMPPEQAAGDRGEIGRTSDVYSLGAILYDLLTGHPPFRADTPLDTLRQVIDTEPAPPRLVNGKVPRDLETICLKCLAKLPTQRYASAKELADDLGRFLRQEPIHARPVNSIGRMWRWARRQPTLAGLAGAVAVLFLLLALAAFMLRHDVGVGVLDNAQAKAGRVAGELLRLRLVVHAMASSPELADLIRSRDLPALSRFLEGRLRDPGTSLPPWIRGQNWVIMTNGWTMLRWPEPSNHRDHLDDRSRRDYYTGALARAGEKGVDAVHVSRFYRSAEDGHYKFGASEVVHDPEGRVVGVLALMLRPVNLAEALGISDDRTRTVIFAGWDSSTELHPADTAGGSPTKKPEFVIWYHPGFGTNDMVEPVSHRFLADLVSSAPRVEIPSHATAVIQTRMDWFYRDPIARRRPELAGFWLGGFARVPNAPFVVVSESRDRVADAFATAVALVVCGLGCFFGWRWTRSRSRPCKEVGE